jgi:hypothetical protein
MWLVGFRMNIQGKFVRKEGHGLNMVREELFFPGSLE